MTSRNILGALVIASLVGGFIVVQSLGPVPALDIIAEASPVRADTAVVVMVDRQDLWSSSKQGLLPDGGLVPFAFENDGGVVVLDAYPCVRRRVGSPISSCMRTFPGDIARDFGEGARFFVSIASGPDCEPVACSVWARGSP